MFYAAYLYFYVFLYRGWLDQFVPKPKVDNITKGLVPVLKVVLFLNPLSEIPLVAAGIIASIPAIFLAFVLVRSRDYVFLYQSYDDNTVADKLWRLTKLIGTSFGRLLCSPFVALYWLCRRKRHRTATVEWIEARRQHNDSPERQGPLTRKPLPVL